MQRTVQTIQAQKQRGERVTMLTCYDYSTAKLMDGILDMLLVGDSLGNVMLGYDDTLSVTMDDMLRYTAAVSRGAKQSLVVADMPFLSYQTNVRDAVYNAGRLLQEGRAQAVKLEGGKAMCDRVRAIVDAGIPVMGHLGMTPQSVNTLGGFKVQGKDLDAAKKLYADALALQEAGVFAIVLECVPGELATWMTERLDVPTIGIGAGAGCDGQVLVYQDMAGMFSDYCPKFVEKFGEIGKALQDACISYADAVHAGTFPGPKQTYTMDHAVIEALEQEEAKTCES